MNINIPPDSRDWLFADHSGDDGALWSFRYPPPCVPNDEIHFRFDGQLVARASVYKILPPGELDNWAHHGKRYLSGHKVVWLWESFVDLRNLPNEIAVIEEAIRQMKKLKSRKERMK